MTPLEARSVTTVIPLEARSLTVAPPPPAATSLQVHEEQCSGNMLAQGCLAVEFLQYDTAEFNPAVGRCRQEILSKLGLAQNARMESPQRRSGGMNQGMWTLSDASQALILKLISTKRHHPAIPSETECFLKLAKEYPHLVHDRDLAFPLKIFRCKGPAGQNTHDLIVMHKARGECFTDVIFRKMKSRQVSELMRDFEALGFFLGSIHNRCGLQHGDFQPSNVFWDEASGRFTMIDIADLAPWSAGLGAQESDVEHFCQGVRLLAKPHGEQFYSEGVRRFKAGYAKSQQTPS